MNLYMQDTVPVTVIMKIKFPRWDSDGAFTIMGMLSRQQGTLIH